MFKSSLITVEHSFGDAAHPDPKGVLLPRWNQVHGVRIAEFTGAGQDLGDADGVWTRTSGLSVAVRTADCVPILLAREDGTAAAALHAGWRGSLEGIVEVFGTLLKNEGDDASRWRAAIGPSARGCCYEVSQEIADRFQKSVSEAVRERRLDLAVFSAAHLRRIGVQKIDALSYCTICSHDENGFIFHSFRREKNRNRQVSCLTLS